MCHMALDVPYGTWVFHMCHMAHVGGPGSLFFGFFVDVVFFKRYRSGSNRTPPHTHLFCLFLFSFCVPPRLFFARFGRASCFLAVFRGAILGPVRFWDSPGTCSEALFLGREAAGVFVCFSCLVVLFPLLFCFAATHFFSPSRWSRRSGQRVISPAPRPSEGEGSASSAEGWSPPFLGFCRLFW